MDNINGALAFKDPLDINDFNVSAQAMERSIRVWGLCFKVSCKHVGSFNSWKLPLQPCSKVVRKQRA